MKSVFLSAGTAALALVLASPPAMADCVRVKVDPGCWGDTCATRCAATQSPSNLSTSPTIRTLGKRKRPRTQIH